MTEKWTRWPLHRPCSALGYAPALNIPVNKAMTHSTRFRCANGRPCAVCTNFVLNFRHRILLEHIYNLSKKKDSQKSTLYRAVLQIFQNVNVYILSAAAFDFFLLGSEASEFSPVFFSFPVSLISTFFLSSLFIKGQLAKTRSFILCIFSKL